MAVGIEWDTMDTFKHVYEVNTIGYMRVMRKFLPLLRKTDGSRLVNMGSLAAINPAPYTSSYCLSKVAISR